jgi:hypothetical protein
MMVRALNQRQNQAPMRFFEAGTHGQPINNPNRPYKERPEDVEVKETSVGRVHPTQDRVDELEYTETVQGPRRADMTQPNLGRGGRRRAEYPRGNPRDDVWWRLHEGIGEGVLFDEDPEETEDTSGARRANRDPLWKNYSGSVKTRETTEERQEAHRRYLAGRVGDPVGGQRRIAEQIDAAIRGLNPEVFKEDDRKVFSGGHGASDGPSEWGPLVRSAPQPEAAVETFRHPGGPYFDQGTKGMWTDALSSVDWSGVGMWAGGAIGGIAGTNIFRDRRDKANQAEIRQAQKDVRDDHVMWPIDDPIDRSVEKTTIDQVTRSLGKKAEKVGWPFKTHW